MTEPSDSYSWATDKLKFQGEEGNISRNVMPEVILKDYRWKY